MLKKIIISLCLSTMSLLSLTEAMEVPKDFTVTERWLSWTTTFDIEAEGAFLGTVDRRVLTLAPTRYDFFDEKEKLQASAHMRWLSVGFVFDITDSKGKPIGTV